MYLEKGPLIAPLVSATVATQSLASTGQVGRYVAVQQCVVKGVRLVVTTALSSTVGTAILKVRPAHGSATGELSVGTVTLANQAATVGGYQTIMFKDFAGVVCQAGAEICLDITVAAGAGSAIVLPIVEEDPETMANHTAAVALA